MFLIRLFRFLSGYVVFSGKGGFPERFINLCSMNGISLWDAKSSSGTLHAKTSIKGYKRLRPCAKKSGMKIRISENIAQEEIQQNDNSENSADSDFDENEDFVDDDFLEM